MTSSQRQLGRPFRLGAPHRPVCVRNRASEAGLRREGVYGGLLAKRAGVEGNYGYGQIELHNTRATWAGAYRCAN